MNFQLYHLKPRDDGIENGGFQGVFCQGFCFCFFFPLSLSLPYAYSPHPPSYLFILFFFSPFWMGSHPRAVLKSEQASTVLS